MPRLSYRRALTRALSDEMARDESVVVLGEDIRVAAANVTTGLLKKFGPERVRDTPLSEQAFTSFATGAALAGARPVVEFQIPSLLFLVFEQIVNHAHKFPLMTGGQCAVPVTYVVPGSGSRTGWAGGAPTQAVLPYDERLRLLPNYLQQLVMESLGKRVRLDGTPVQGDTVPVWWGGPGTDTQHSFFQALHQGTQVVPSDFIGVVRSDNPHADNHAALLANLLAQAEAFANGRDSDDPHRAYPGNRPSTLLLLDALTPQSLGMLVALYEHSVYLQSVAWGINAFDQFGVELGKEVAGKLLPAVKGEAEAEDVVTQSLLREMRSRG